MTSVVLYDGMLLTSNGKENEIEQVKQQVKNTEQSFKASGDEHVTGIDIQLFHNHDHYTREDAFIEVYRIRNVVKKKYPELFLRLVFDWRERDDPDGEVILSFYAESNERSSYLEPAKG